MTSILVVDDDPGIRDLLKRYLTQEGFEVLTAENAKGLHQALTRKVVDLIILDVRMPPGDDGVVTCRKLRMMGDNTPIIMLTAKVDDVDQIVGLEAGADDYVTKPFNPRVLLARIQTVLRRKPLEESSTEPSADNPIVKFGEFSFDLSKRILEKNGVHVPLTTGEFSLLKVLVRNPRRALSREKLMKLAKNRELAPYDRSIDVQVARLRKLIEADLDHPRYIQTVWAEGYVFCPD